MKKSFCIVLLPRNPRTNLSKIRERIGSSVSVAGRRIHPSAYLSVLIFHSYTHIFHGRLTNMHHISHKLFSDNHKLYYISCFFVLFSCFLVCIFKKKLYCSVVSCFLYFLYFFYFFIFFCYSNLAISFPNLFK